MDAPTATADDPRASTYIIDHLKPGAAIERRIEVVNHSASDARVRVYPAAASISKGGFVGAAGSDQNELTSWTSSTPEELELAPEEKSFVKVTIKVPADAVRGEQYGVVWAETETAPSTEGGVTQVGRVGVRLYLSVGPGGAPSSDFEVVSLAGIRDENSVPMVQASVRNTGERALDLKGELNLAKGPAGLAAGPFPIPVGTTLGIGETLPLLIPLDAELPDGPWLAKITMKSGVTERSAQATISFPAGPGTGPAIATETDEPVPWWMIAGGALILGALLALVALLVWRRLRLRRTPSPELAAPIDPAPRRMASPANR